VTVAAPHEVVIGTSDISAGSRLWEVLGYEVVAEDTYDADHAALSYRLDAPTTWRRLALPSRPDRGTVRLVATPHAPVARPVTSLGPLAVDVYTADLDRSLGLLTDAGIAHGPRGTIDLGALVMHQAEVITSDGWRLVLVEANHRRPSALDDDPDLLHSEVHSVLWTVPSIEEATPAFEQAGLTQTHVFPIRHPELARIISLPDSDTLLRMNLLVDDEQRPIRVELCEFPEDATADAPPDQGGGVLCPGIHALAFDTTGSAARAFPGGVRIEGMHA
jgi:hypothetical protein